MFLRITLFVLMSCCALVADARRPCRVRANSCVARAVNNNVANCQVQAVSTLTFISVAVPSNAILVVNGLKTKSRGPRRVFQVNCNANSTYSFKFVASVTKNNQVIEETQVVRLRSGQRPSLKFNFDTSKANVVAATQQQGQEAGPRDPSKLFKERKVVEAFVVPAPPIRPSITVPVTSLDEPSPAFAKKVRDVARGSVATSKSRDGRPNVSLFDVKPSNVPGVVLDDTPAARLKLDPETLLNSRNGPRKEASGFDDILKGVNIAPNNSRGILTDDIDHLYKRK